MYPNPIYCQCVENVTTYLSHAVPCSLFPLQSWEVLPVPSRCTCCCPSIWWCMALGIFGKGAKGWSGWLVAVCASTTRNKNLTPCGTNSFLVVPTWTDEWSSIQGYFHCLTTWILENPLVRFGKLTVLFVRMAYTNTAAIQELDHRR